MKRPDKVEHSWMNEAEVERYVTDLEKYCDRLEGAYKELATIIHDYKSVLENTFPWIDLDYDTLDK